MAVSYKQIRDQITTYLTHGEPKPWAEVLLAGPDLLHLMISLARDARVPTSAKLKLAGAVAYFVSPFDFLPEALLGPVGYLDDVALAALVLHGVLESIPTEVVAEHWAGQGSVLEVVRGILAKANQFLGARIWGKLRGRK